MAAAGRAGFAQTQKSISAMSAQEASVYLAGLDKALDTANEQLYHTINTKAGVPSQNPNLDGYIPEQYHAQTFNLNAEATGSEYSAKVLEPDGAYGKNSVDVVIVDGEGKIVKRYRCKYGQDSHATGEMFKRGLPWPRKTDPDGQEIEKKSSNVIEAPDGTTSKPLSKEKAKQMQEEAQSGNWSELNWNEYQVKDLAMGIGKQAGTAALQGAVIGAGIAVAQKVWNGEEIERAGSSGGCSDRRCRLWRKGSNGRCAESSFRKRDPLRDPEGYARRHFCKYRIRCGGKCKGAGQGCHWGTTLPGGF